MQNEGGSASAVAASTDVTHRLLAVDGGGLRGAFSLGVLGCMEQTLKRVTGAGDDFRLSSYFDFIGGTSTGALIATGLALGWSVDEIKDKYLRLGREVFSPRFAPLRLWSKYPGGPLRQQLEKEFGQRTFGDTDLRTRLLIVMHNRSTDSAWPLSNAPEGRYNDRSKPTRCNIDQRLCDLLAASTAAPSFFPPVILDFGAGKREYVDGGITAHNNPSLQLLLSATLPEYGVNWATGPDKLLLISVGTGSAPTVVNNLSKARRHLLYVAMNTPGGLMFAAANNNDVVCRALGDVAFGPWLDSELTDLTRGLNTKLFRYARYNIELNSKGLGKVGMGHLVASQLSKLDAKDEIENLMDLGSAYGGKYLEDSHFDGFTTLHTTPPPFRLNGG